MGVADLPFLKSPRMRRGKQRITKSGTRSRTRNTDRVDNRIHRKWTPERESYLDQIRAATRINRERDLATARRVAAMVGYEFSEQIFEVAISHAAAKDSPFGYLLTVLKDKVPQFVETQKRIEIV